MNKKGQAGQTSAGMITALVMGIAGLVIGVIIALVVVSTLTGSELLASTSNSVMNESGGYINATGFTLAGAAASGNPRSYSITTVHNNTDALVILSGNYTVSSIGVVTNATTTTWEDVNITYSYTTDGIEEAATDRMSGNFTAGIDEVSSKLPTVLLIAAIILILGILAVLVAVWQRMKMGQGGL